MIGHLSQVKEMKAEEITQLNELLTSEMGAVQLLQKEYYNQH